MNRNNYIKQGISKLLSIGFLLMLILLNFSAKAQDGCMLVELPLNQRVQQSNVIIEGKVISQESFWGNGRRNIFTKNTVQIYKVFKGNYNLRTIDIITQGGQVGDVGQELTSLLKLNVGDMGILTCIPNPYQESGVAGYTAFGSMQGFIKYDTDNGSANDPFKKYNSIENELHQLIKGLTNRPIIEITPNPYLETLRRRGGNINNPNTNRDILAIPTITGFSPTSITSGTSSSLTITGTNFGASQGTGFVEFKNANDGGGTWVKPLTTDYVSWSNTQIVVKVPSVSQTGPGAGTGQIRVTNADPNSVTSAGSVTITYAYSNYNKDNYARIPTHMNHNSFGGYFFSMNNSFAANTSAANKMRAILNTWTCASGMNWLLGANTAVSSVANDGINVMTFVASLPAGVLASCSSWYYTCGSGATSTAFVGEIDVVISAAFTWYYGATPVPAGQYDFESVMLHEMGHGHQLNHSIDAAAVMHYAISSGQAKRTINANETNGAIYIKNNDIAVGTVCGSTPPMTVLGCNAGTSAPIVTFTANRTNVVAGCSLVTFTASAGPEVTGWSWNFNGGATNSTLQNPTVTFSTPGTYTVTLTATNAYGSTPFTRTSYITVTSPICTATNTNFVGTPNDYSVTGGRLAGHNGAGDLAFADKFSYCGVATKLTQLKLYFNLRTGTGNILAKVWSADGANGSPGTELFSQSVAISALQAYPNATTVTLPTALSITGDYYIGYQIVYAGSDAVSLITNAQGESAVSTGWRKSSTNVWASYLTLYGLSLSLKVDAVFNNTPAPVITPGGATTFCSGNNVVLNANTAPGYTYLWYNGAASTGITTSSYTATTSGNYTVRTTYGSCTVASAVTTVTVNDCANADLSNLVPSTGTLSPSFAAGTISYTMTVPNATSSMTVTPTVAVAGATIKVNTVTVASGSASGAIALAVGANTITTVVTALNGTTTKTYTITVTRTGSNNADLSNLVPSTGTLSPSFAAATTSYSMTVPNATSSMTVTPTIAGVGATVRVNTVLVTSGSPSGAIALAVGANTITTVVTAQDGTTTRTYTITVTRTAASTNNNLSGLVPSTGTLSPVFAQATISYSMTVPFATSSMTVTPTAADAFATITVNTVSVTSGSPSGSLALAVGSNTITTVVTAQSGATKTYTITVTRTAASTNNNLSNLVPSTGTLSPVFAQATISYSMTVPFTTTAMTVTPTVADALATVTVNSTPVTSGSPSGSLALAVGANTITTVVTAQSGATKTYTITVTRTAAATNNNLSGLAVSVGTLTPSFISSTVTYSVTVPTATSAINVTPTVADAFATLTVNSTSHTSGTPRTISPLAFGNNTVTVVVTAQSGATKTYTITVVRPFSTNANLSNLVPSTGTLSPAFAQATIAYTMSVPNATSSMTITPTVADAFATIKVNTVTVASGSPSASIPLAVGTNTITTVVTAQDGTTTKTYTITVTRASGATTSILNLTMFIQGYYIGGNAMTPVMENQGITEGPLVEDITVELRHQTTYALIATATGLLQTNGSLSVSYNNLTAGSYYIALKGRNMIQTWSASPVAIGGISTSYDFSSAATQAYGDNMINMGSGVWALYSGDTNQDGSVDLSDYSSWEADFNEFAFGNYPTDLNGDGSVDLTDYSLWEQGFNNFIFAFTPL